MTEVNLTGETLTIEQLVRVARHGSRVALSNDAHARVTASSAALDAHVRAGRPIYGLTTGVGALDGAVVSAEDNRRYQRNLLRSHAAGVGASMLDDQVRAMMAARANTLARGMSGVRVETLLALLAMLNRGVTPIVPEGGSVGASDLAPLAHMALVMVGEGRATFKGDALPGSEALSRAKIEPPTLTGRDGLALINGLAQTTGIGALSVHDARRLAGAAEVAAAMSIAALQVPIDFLDDRLAAARPHAGSVESARRLRDLVGTSRGGQPALRAPLSARYSPSILGACRDAVASCDRVLGVELNAAVDNPLLFEDDWLTSNSGTTSGQCVGEALDMLATSLISVAVAAERRVNRLVGQRGDDGAPAFLVPPGVASGLHSGLMVAQYTAASLVAELRVRSVPASIQSIPTCADSEDHVSMSALAARRLAWAVSTAETVVAIELLAAAQAVDVWSVAPTAALRTFHRQIREGVPVLVADRVLSDSIQAVVALLRTGTFDAADAHASG